MIVHTASSEQTTTADTTTAPAVTTTRWTGIPTTPKPATSTLGTGIVTATEAGVTCKPNPCRNHGVCSVRSTAPNGFVCTCPPKLWGPLCEEGISAEWRINRKPPTFVYS